MKWCFHEKNILFIFHYCNFHFGDQNPEMETKWRPIFAKSLNWRPKSPNGDLFGNTVTGLEIIN